LEAGHFDGALRDVTVLELSGLIAGSYCTRLLAGLGAEVIKIEPPEEGDFTRKLTPLDDSGDVLENGALFHHLNASKKSITLSLASHKGVNLLRRLIGKAEIVVESLGPGAMDSLGLGFNDLARRNPDVVVTSISPFGQDGPYRDYPASDLILQAMGGLMFTCGDPKREPIKIGGRQTEYVAGLNAAVGTMGAYLAAEISGEGKWIDISIMESVVSILQGTTVAYTRQNVVRRRQGNRHGPAYSVSLLPCKDGYVAVMLPTDDDWEMFARLASLDQLLEKRFAKAERRLRFADEIEVILRPFLMERTRTELFSWAQELRLPFSIVLTLDELLDDLQHQARDFFTAIDHPVAGDVLQIGPPFKMFESGWRIDRAPLLGEHTEQVFREKLGLDEGELWELRQDGTI
jgi:crotonobetainyl-CoA:carnitine CoA-transferase CaiB-like acyl-CoA transferase